MGKTATEFTALVGFGDTADEMFKYLSFEGFVVRPDTLRRFCELRNQNVEWVAAPRAALCGGQTQHAAMARSIG
ncbi:MAG: hypothetical protein R3E09_06075 [Novosphingobium sp.]|nr:hypothetical protein [Novosphingobium sp.]